MKIALVGNQNSGKTTLFNCLTGMNAKIGNWPGVTIEKKSGIIKDTSYEIIDLPGIYSLSPYSIEEDVSRKFIFEEEPDIIVNIVDSTSIERSLYLTTQLLELDCKVIIALNMVDALEKKGINIDINKLEDILGSKVVKISALKQVGIKELINEINNPQDKQEIRIYDSKIENSISKIEFYLKENTKYRRFISVKLLEEDERFISFKNRNIDKTISELKQNLNIDISIEEMIATQRYNFISYAKNKTVKINKKNINNITEKLDKFLLNKWIAFPIFVVIMFLIYFLSVGVVGKFTIQVISNFIDMVKETANFKLMQFGVSIWLNSLIVDGIISGVGAVLNFIPQLVILFLCISLLETTGYMSRIALLLDKVFRRIGLSGKSLIPFIIGSGCSVPGIMGTRIIENEDERKMTAILTPFIPCSAKLPIIVLFTSCFFRESSGLVSVSLYFLSIIIIIISAIFMKKFIFKNTSSTYISELPDYKMPNAKYVIKDVFEKVKGFIKKAGTIIFLCSIIIWFLLSFSLDFKYCVNIEEGILASIGKKISWIFYPILGTNSWEMTVSSIQGLVAKEQVVSSISVISGLANNESNYQMFDKGNIFGFFTKASAYAYIVFNLFSAPCLGAISSLKKELGSIKSTIKVVVFQIIFAWCLASITYQIGSRIENNIINLKNVIVISIIIAIIIRIIILNNKRKENECRNCPYCDSCTKG